MNKNQDKVTIRSYFDEFNIYHDIIYLFPNRYRLHNRYHAHNNTNYHLHNYYYRRKPDRSHLSTNETNQ